MSENAKEFFTEVALQLRKSGFEPQVPYEGRLSVNWRGTPLGQMTPDGMLCYEPADNSTDQVRSQLCDITRGVAEYMTKMETAPQIKANGLEGDYRTLAEFNDIVLAGHQTKYGMEFVTWEWVQNHTSLWQGHYTDSYDAAKRDFATRSGLLPPEQLFTYQQLAEMYRCVHETLESDYSITPEREKLLTGIVEQIETAVPCLDELVQRSNEQEATQAPPDYPSMTQQF